MQKKNRRSHVVPLAPQAFEIFQKAFERSDCQFAFPGKGKLRRRPLSRTTASLGWARNRDKPGLSDIHVHDLRRTFVSRLGSLGVMDAVIALAVNHHSARPKITAGYNQATYEKEKRELFERWEAELMRILDPESNVVPLRSA